MGANYWYGKAGKTGRHRTRDGENYSYRVAQQQEQSRGDAEAEET